MKHIQLLNKLVVKYPEIKDKLPEIKEMAKTLGVPYAIYYYISDWSDQRMYYSDKIFKNWLNVHYPL